MFTAATAMAQSTDRPNIIFFLADDMGWQDTSLPFWDQPTPQNARYRTPNMERLAQRGMMFTNAYACPVSSPSRSSLISGMNAARHGVTNWIENYDQNTNASGSNLTLPEWNWNGVQPAATATTKDRSHSTLITPLPKLLKDAGYMTIHCGKGNFGAAQTSASNPLKLGFDVNIAGGSNGGPGSYLAQDNYGSAIQSIGGLETYASKGVFLTEALTQEAIKNLNKAVAAEKPFYLYMSHYAIHTPYHADTRFTANYEGYFDRLYNATLSTDEVNRAALIEGMDKSLGDLMDWLDERPDIAQNTVILFMSDNGGHAVWPRQGRLNHDPNYPSRGGKGSAYDGGVHEPMIVAWPNVVAEGTKNANRVMIEDYFPSILEMAGVKDYRTVQTVDGVSFVDLLRNPELSRERTLIWHYPNRWGDASDRAEGYTAWSAIMKGDYHLIYFWENQERQLFNIRQDISEEHNLAKEMPELTLQLAQELTDSLQAYGAKRPVLIATGEIVPWPVDGVQMAGPGDAVKVADLGIQLSTADGEKHLYYVIDARTETDYWTQGRHNGYPAIQTYVGVREGDKALKQQFYFMQGDDPKDLLIYTADDKAVIYADGLTRSGYSATDQVKATYLQYSATKQPTPFQAVMTNDEGYYGLTVGGEFLSNRGSANGAENNLGWVVMPFAGSNYTDKGCRFKFVSIDYNPNEGLPRLTTDPDNPVYYRIRNTRCYAQSKASYAYLHGANASLSLLAKPDRATKFYFTGTVENGLMTVKIHNSGNARLMAGEAKWDANGCDWYIKLHTTDQGGIDPTTGKPYAGVLICNTADFKESWYVGSSDSSIKLYGSQWDGNLFTLEEVEQPNAISPAPHESNRLTSGPIYDLSGRPALATSRGIKIANGRKVK